MNKLYLPTQFVGKLAHVVEEMGEALAACGKVQRYGLTCHNPELPTHEQESNRIWLRRELKDVQGAIERLLADKEML